MKLGGFVIFKNNADTIGQAVRSLLQICDEVVAIDTGSVDESADIVDALGVRRVVVRWQGFGAARTAAVAELVDSDFVFFLDSDESINSDVVRVLREWKRSRPCATFYSLMRQDWFFVGESPKFVFRKEWRKRLVRRDAAVWDAGMIVHEALPSVPAVRLMVSIQHRFADETSLRSTKDRAYALLWAVMNSDSGARVKPRLTVFVAHFVRNAILKGGAIRGLLTGLRLSVQAAQCHSAKYRYLARVRRGEFVELVSMYRNGKYSELFASVQSLQAGRCARPARRDEHAAL